MSKSNKHSKGVGALVSIDAGDLARAGADLGIDLSTLPDLSLPSPRAARDVIDESSSEYVDRICREHLRRDLTDAESVLLHSAIWKHPTYITTVDKARDIWRMVTFMRRHAIALKDIPSSMLVPGIDRRGNSSTVHRWMRAGMWSRAQEILSRLPYSEWSESRRAELDDLVTWESELAAAAEKRKAKSLHDKALRESAFTGSGENTRRRR